MIVVLLNSIAWIQYVPKPEATKSHIVTNTLFQGLCNMALLIWKTFFFSFSVLKEEENMYIVIQIVSAIFFETFLPRILGVNTHSRWHEWIYCRLSLLCDPFGTWFWVPAFISFQSV
ncbi:hypothetical protein QYM36_007000 [Artemia franciscana]|nr:hypothetical protein QYM36_007000 [Artemia franciscana]KAK2716707.1 hypothetical protein QYM36_007000 [Artemia franciscana]